MANTNVYTGADGSITLSAASDVVEGKDAQEIIDGALQPAVGRVQGVTIEVSSAVRPFHEIGQRYASELRAGNVTVRGTIKRAYLNGALLRLLLGKAAVGSSWVQPAFNISLLSQNAAQPGVSSTIMLQGVKFDQWNYAMPEDDFVMESASFQALYLTVSD